MTQTEATMPLYLIHFLHRHQSFRWLELRSLLDALHITYTLEDGTVGSQTGTYHNTPA